MSIINNTIHMFLIGIYAHADFSGCVCTDTFACEYSRTEKS